MDGIERDRLRQLVDDGFSIRQIAAELGVSYTTVLAGQARDHDAARSPARRDSAGPASGCGDNRGGVADARRHDVRPAWHGRFPLPAVPHGRGPAPPLRDQADPCRRSRWRVCALRLRPHTRRPALPPSRPCAEGLRALPARRHALSRRRARRGGEVRAAVLELPCGG